MPKTPISPSDIEEWVEEQANYFDFHLLAKHIAWVLNDPPALKSWRQELQKLAQKRERA